MYLRWKNQLWLTWVGQLGFVFKYILQSHNISYFSCFFFISKVLNIPIWSNLKCTKYAQVVLINKCLIWPDFVRKQWYMAGVRWQVRRSRSDVAEMCGLKNFMLSWGREDWESLDIRKGLRGCVGWSWEGESWGWRPVGRLRKKWSECVMEDMNLCGVEEYVKQDKQMWKAVTACPTPSKMGKYRS